MSTEIIDTPEAARRLRVSESYLRKQTAARLVPHRRVGRRVYFTDSDLKQIVESWAERPAPARPAVRRVRGAAS